MEIEECRFFVYRGDALEKLIKLIVFIPLKSENWVFI